MYVGKSSYFSLATDSIKSDLKISGTNDFSAGFWFYTTTSVPRILSIGRAETIAAGDGFFAVYVDASLNMIIFTVSTYTSSTVFETGGTMKVPITLSQWNHVVFTYDSTSRQMNTYINNAFVSRIKRSDAAWAITAGKGIMAAGADGSGTTVSKWQIGSINVAWGRIWTDSDVEGLYNNDWKPQLKVEETFSPKINPTFNGKVVVMDKLAIGMNPTVYELQLSTDSAAKLSTSTWATYSDERLKENIVIADYNMCFETIANLDLKYFKWRDDIKGLGSDAAPDRHKLGWIAQEVEPLFPRAVDNLQNMFGLTDVKTVNADQIYACMYGAVKKLIEKNAALEVENEALQASIVDIQDILARNNLT